jgi:hypothetical protein
MGWFGQKLVRGSLIYAFGRKKRPEAALSLASVGWQPPAWRSSHRFATRHRLQRTNAYDSASLGGFERSSDVGAVEFALDGVGVARDLFEHGRSFRGMS